MSPGFDRVPVQVCVYFFCVGGEDYVETLTEGTVYTQCIVLVSIAG